MRSSNRFYGPFMAIVLISLFAATSCTSQTSRSPTSTAAPSPTPAPSPAPNTKVSSELTAEKFAFDKDTMTVPPGAEVTIHFNNKDAGVPHNFSLYTDSSASPPAIYSGKVITGPATITYTFTAPSIPGSYFFRCDIHPKTMIGTFVVQ